MMLRFIYTFLGLVTLAFAQDAVVGEDAPTYAVGGFTYPNARSTNFSVGQTIDITWNTTITRLNVFLITNNDYANSQVIASE